jgi:class 3 adenylate cyclase
MSVPALPTARAAVVDPGTRAGIAAAPLVVRDGDVYGYTVNLPARNAA